MITIQRYKLESTPHQVLRVPSPAHVVAIDDHSDGACVACFVDPQQPDSVDLHIYAFAAGDDLCEANNLGPCIGTSIIRETDVVLYYFTGGA